MRYSFFCVSFSLAPRVTGSSRGVRVPCLLRSLFSPLRGVLSSVVCCYRAGHDLAARDIPGRTEGYNTLKHQKLTGLFICGHMRK